LSILIIDREQCTVPDVGTQMGCRPGQGSRNPDIEPLWGCGFLSKGLPGYQCHRDYERNEYKSCSVHLFPSSWSV
jgi:hypothetical protein